MLIHAALTSFGFGGNTLLLRSRTGSGFGIPTASQTSRIARYLALVSRVLRLALEVRYLPSADNAKEAEASRKLQQVQDVLQVGLCCGSSRSKIGCGDKGKEHHEAEERQCEKDVDTKRADHQNEGYKTPAICQVASQSSNRKVIGLHGDIVEGLR